MRRPASPRCSPRPQVCRQLYAQEGAAGFARGLGARVATMSTGSAVTWLTYEGVKRWLARPAAQQPQQQQLSTGLHGAALQEARSAE